MTASQHLQYVWGHKIILLTVTSNTLCMEAQEYMVMGRWLDLASLMLTSAELVFPKVSDKGIICIVLGDL